MAPGATGAVPSRMLGCAKEVRVVDAYNKQFDLIRFDLMIDWGWFYFITKPMFQFMDWIFRLVGNFGVAILIVTVAINGIFFPLANNSYASMPKMSAALPPRQKIPQT